MPYDPQIQQALSSKQQQHKKEKEENAKEETSDKKNDGARKSLTQRILPLPVASRLSQIKKTDAAIFIALAAAGLKDILDLISLSGFGYLLVIILTILIFIFIGLMILFATLSGGGGGLHLLLSLLGGTLVEMLPGVDLLPATMGTVMLIYWRILSKRKKNQAKIQANYA